MKKVLLIIVLAANLFAAQQEVLSIKTDTRCDQVKLEVLRAEVAKDPGSAAIIFLEAMEEDCKQKETSK